MKISIITVCYNSEKTIQRTIDSLKRQNINKIEYILVDGASTDTTNNIINKNIKILEMKGIEVKVISEKDSGIYNAMNKGLKLATGEIVGILNSDDYYLDETLKKVQENFKECDILVGNICLFSQNKSNKLIKSKLNLNKRMTICHPATFLKLDVYKKIGFFDESFKIAADYDFISRCFKNKMRIKLIDETLVMMSDEGVSNQKKYLKTVLLENKRVREINKFGKLNNLFYFIKDYISLTLKGL